MSRVFYKHRVAFHGSAEEGVDDESFNSETETARLLLVMMVESAMALQKISRSRDLQESSQDRRDGRSGDKKT
jgi:hypothetical protein